MSDINEIIESAKEELTEQYNPELQYPEDLAIEIADGAVPFSTHDIISCANKDLSLATDELELGPANGSNFTGEATPVNIIAANIYERVSNALYQHLYELQSS